MASDVLVTIPRKTWEDVLDFWEEAMEARFAEASEWWGTDAERALWPSLFELLKGEAREATLDYMDPKVLVDNYLINSEICVRSGFCAGGEWECYWKEYGGDWDALCKDAIVHIEKDLSEESDEDSSADSDNGLCEKKEAYALMRY